MTRCFVLALFFAVILGGLRQPLSAETPPLTETPLLPGLQQIVDSRKLVVAVINQEVPPMIFTGDDGELAGFDIALARAIGDDIGVQIEFNRSAETSDEVVRLVAAGEADLGISSLARSPQRARSVLFTRAYLRQHATLMINRQAGLRFRGSCPSAREALNAAEFSGMLGVEIGSYLLAQLRELNPEAQPREFQGAEDLMTAVRVGEVAISLQGELTARRFLQLNPAAHIHLRLCQIPGPPRRIAIAVRPGQYDLLNWLNVFLEERGILFDAADLIGRDQDWSF